MSCAVARGYGAVAFVVWGKARRAGMINLRRALGMTASQARRATFTVFANLGRSIAEGLQFVRRYRDDPDAWRRFCRIEDPELAKRILDDSRPKIFVTSHLGSWEVATMIVDLAVGGRGAGIARRVDNRWLDALVKRVRLRDRTQWIEKHGAASEALRRLANGESIMMLLDENGGPRGPFVPFFGRLSSTRKTPALLSIRTGAPIVVGAVVRDETKRQPAFVFKLALVDVFGAPASEPAGPPASSRQDAGGPAARMAAFRSFDGIVPTTARINAVLESWIRETPMQWRWIHWRWRTRPDGTEERYGRRELRACFAERR
jgi:KDO2-lipid IV(A) lauroyltransferase